MKILFVAPWMPSEERPRSLRFLEILASRHDVHVIAVAESGAQDLVRLRGVSVDMVKDSRSATLLRSARGLFSGRPLQEAYADSSALRDAVLVELDLWKPDIVHLNVFRTAHLIEQVQARSGAQAIVVDLDEFRSEYYSQLGEGSRNPLWRMIGRLEAVRMRRREQVILKRDIDVLVSGPREVPTSSLARVSVVRSICDARPPRTEPEASTSVLFVGRLSYEANVEGLDWFLRSCWPAITARLPGAVLHIVGADPPKSVILAGARDVIVHGRVDSVGPFYDAASVAIVPIFRGTGVQMKLLQALAAGVPVVSTKDAASRAGVRAREQVLVADTADEWIEAVLEMISDGDLRRTLAQAGQQWIAGTHDSSVVAAQLLGVYDSLRPERVDRFSSNGEDGPS